jgi:hypothetical protein
MRAKAWLFRGILVVVALFSCSGVWAQFEYGAPGVTEGSLSYEGRETTVDLESGRPVRRQEVTYRVESRLMLMVVHRDLASWKTVEASQARLRPNAGQQRILPTVVTGSNFSRTLAKGETLAAVYSGKVTVPRHVVTMTYSEKVYGPDPCKPEPGKLVLIGETTASGAAKGPHAAGASVYGEDRPGDGFRVLFGAEAVGLNRPGTVGVPGTARTLVLEPDGKCRWQSNPTLVFVRRPRGSEVGTTVGGGLARGGPALYRRASADGTVTTYKVPVVSRAEMLSYLENRPKFQAFSLSGAYQFKSRNQEVSEQVSASLRLGMVGQGEVLLAAASEDVYDRWTPLHEDDPKYEKITLKATFKTDGKVQEDILHFSLDSSRHPGISNNYPRPEKSDTEPDLYFPKQQSDPNIVYVSEKEVRTRIPVHEAKVDIACRDYGAYGELRTLAVNHGVWGKNRYDKRAFLPIPRDQDADKIADAWEDDPAVNMHPKNPDAEDAETVTGHQTAGDGMTFRTEYRGFHVLDNGKTVWKRLDPKAKEVFLLDPRQMAETDPWQKVTGMTLHFLTPDLQRSEKKAPRETAGLDPSQAEIVNDLHHRTVDFNGPEKKLSIPIHVQSGMEDPLPGHTKDHLDPAVWRVHTSYTTSDGIHLFPDRIAESLRLYAEDLRSAVEDPANVWGKKALQELATANSMTEAQIIAKAKAAIPVWQNGGYQPYIREFRRWIALHELGHALSVAGHSRVLMRKSDQIALVSSVAQPVDTSGKHPDYVYLSESGEGAPSCLMTYHRNVEKFGLVLFGKPGPGAAYLGRAQFCDAAPDHCRHHLDAKTK